MFTSVLALEGVPPRRSERKMTCSIETAPPELQLKVDPYRTGAKETGVQARCLESPGVYKLHDIAHLDAASLLAWLRSKGGCNPWAENTIAALLHHEEPIAPEGEAPPRVPSDLE